MLTTSWFEGYVGLDDYITHYYENLSPFQLGWLCHLCGFQAPSVTTPFTYIDICSGRGVSLVLHAANFPHAQFYGVDLSSSHVAQSRDLARRAGLSNIEFFESSVEDMNALDLPPVDFAVIQGSYSWLSKKNQSAVRHFLERKLQPGGIFQVHYISYPGAVPSEGMLRLIYDYARHESGTPAERLKRTLERLEIFTTIKMGAFSDPEGLKRHLKERFNKQDHKHLAHDLLSRDRRGHFFTQMASEMRQARMEYICSNVPYRNLPLATYGKNVVELLPYLTEQDHIELIKDFSLGESVRRDIYQRGKMILSPSAQIDGLRQMRFVRMTSPANIQSEIKTNGFSMNLPARQIAIYKDVMKTPIFTGQQLIEALTAAAPEDGVAPNQYINGLPVTLMIMYMVGYLRPLLETSTAQTAQASCQSLNNLTLSLSPTDSSLSALASANLGAGITLNPLDRLILKTLSENGWQEDNLHDHVINTANRLGMRLTQKSDPTDPQSQTPPAETTETGSPLPQSNTITTSAHTPTPSPATPDTTNSTNGSTPANPDAPDPHIAMRGAVDSFIKDRIPLYRDLGIISTP